MRDIGVAVDAPENTRSRPGPTAAPRRRQRHRERPRHLLVVFKQPGANVIETVDAIKAALPRLQAAIPPAVKVDIMVDRTQTIRASVATWSSR